MQHSGRLPEQVREHYEVEKELAEKLMAASALERRIMYTALYDELFRRVPHHPQLSRKFDPQRQKMSVSSQLQVLMPFLCGDQVVLEIGPGDCALLFEISGRVRKVIGIDVCNTITDQSHCPGNFELHITDGTSIPLPKGSVDLVYSNQLMEHLHPDDALVQLKNIVEVLNKGGVYLCVTPNRLNGPHDISKFFDYVAKGFHLKEYSVGELVGLFRAVGFRRVRMVVGTKGRYFQVPVWPSIMVEKTLCLLPTRLRRKIARLPLIRHAIYPRIAGIR